MIELRALRGERQALRACLRRHQFHKQIYLHILNLLFGDTSIWQISPTVVTSYTQDTHMCHGLKKKILLSNLHLRVVDLFILLNGDAYNIFFARF